MIGRFSTLPETPQNMPRPGDRVAAVNFAPSTVIDDNVTVPPGTYGTVWMADDLQIGVQWDNGSTINLVPGDEWEVIVMAACTACGAAVRDANDDCPKGCP